MAKHFVSGRACPIFAVIAIVAGFGARASAAVENFGGLSTGNINGQNNWAVSSFGTGNGATVVTSPAPFDGTNPSLTMLSKSRFETGKTAARLFSDMLAGREGSQEQCKTFSNQIRPPRKFRRGEDDRNQNGTRGKKGAIRNISMTLRTYVKG